MKRIFLLFCLVFMTLCANAQNFVYFGNLDNKLSVGVGIQKFNPNVTFSIMEIDKHKSFDDFSFKCVNADGEDLAFTYEVDTIIHLDMDKNYAHQIDYTFNIMEYRKMCKDLNNVQTLVYINDVEYNGAAFVGILRALEQEQNVMFSGAPNNFKDMTFWNWQRQNMHNIEFMRFRNPNNKRNFRYVRRIENNNK